MRLLPGTMRAEASYTLRPLCPRRLKGEISVWWRTHPPVWRWLALRWALLCAACVFPANVEQTVLSLRWVSARRMVLRSGHPREGQRSALMASTVCRQTAGRKGARVFLGPGVAKQSIQPMARHAKKNLFVVFFGGVGGV